MPAWNNWLEATRIGLRPNGEVYKQDVFLMYNQPDSLPVAMEKVSTGRMVFVRREDADAVFQMWKEKNSEHGQADSVG